MSLKTKKRFKNLGKTIGIGLFTLLMLTNIKFALMDDSEIASGDISVLGIEMQLFDATYASEGSQDKLSYEKKNNYWYYCCSSAGQRTCPSVYPDCDE